MISIPTARMKNISSLNIPKTHRGKLIYNVVLAGVRDRVADLLDKVGLSLTKARLSGSIYA